MLSLPFVSVGDRAHVEGGCLGTESRACVPRIRGSERPDPVPPLPNPQLDNLETTLGLVKKHNISWLPRTPGAAPSRRYKAGIRRASFTAQNAPVKEMMFPWYLVEWHCNQRGTGHRER